MERSLFKKTQTGYFASIRGTDVYLNDVIRQTELYSDPENLKNALIESWEQMLRPLTMGGILSSRGEVYTRDQKIKIHNGSAIVYYEFQPKSITRLAYRSRDNGNIEIIIVGDDQKGDFLAGGRERALHNLVENVYQEYGINRNNSISPMTVVKQGLIEAANTWGLGKIK